MLGLLVAELGHQFGVQLSMSRGNDACVQPCPASKVDLAVNLQLP